MHVYKQLNVCLIFSSITGNWDEIHQRIVELEMNIKMLVPCQCMGSHIIEIRLLQTLILDLKVKFMGVVIGQGNAVSPVSN